MICIVNAGSSGAVVYRVESTHYYLMVAWSAPRNFYTHSNTVIAGVSIGSPLANPDSLFDRLYFAENPVNWAKIVCDFGQVRKEGRFADANFVMGASIGQEHRTEAEVTVELARNWAEMADLKAKPTKVFLVAQSKKSNEQRKKEILNENLTFAKIRNDLALVFQTTDDDKSGKLSVVELSKDSDPLPKYYSAQLKDFRKERKRFNASVYFLGEIRVTEEDIKYSALEKISAKSVTDYFQQLMAALNIPYAELIPSSLEENQLKEDETLDTSLLEVGNSIEALSSAIMSGKAFEVFTGSDQLRRLKCEL